MENKKNIIDYLIKFDEEKWFELFDYIFENNSLPSPFVYSINYPTEHFVNLYKLISEASNRHLLNRFNNSLLDYYFSLPNINTSYCKIYHLHNIFYKIKVKGHKSEKLFQQLFTNRFLNIYYEDAIFKTSVHLQTSLLSLLSELPNINNYDISAYLYNTINKTNNIAFYRIALKYFIKQYPTYEYLKYYSLLAKKQQCREKDLANLLVESLMDYRLYKGTFKDLYINIDKNNFWKNLYNENPSLINNITKILSSKYLKAGKNWYDNDIYAQLFLLYINSNKYPPPPIELIKITEKLHQKGLAFGKINFLIGKFFKELDSSEYSIEKIVNNQNKIIYFITYKSTNELDKNILKFYKEKYGINNKNELFIESDNLLFNNIYTLNVLDNSKNITNNTIPDFVKEKFEENFIESEFTMSLV